MSKRILMIIGLPPALFVFWISLFFVSQERIETVWREALNTLQ